MLLVSFVWLSLAGCAPEPEGVIRFERPLDHQTCFEQLDPMRPAFFTARDRIDSLGLFMNSRPDVQADADIVRLEVYAPPRTVNALAGEPIALAGPTDAEPRLRGFLSVDGSCPDLRRSFELRGTVVFEELGAEVGERVRGEIIEGRVVMVSDDEVETTVVEDVSGRWDFTVQRGTPYSDYPTFDEEYRRSP